tara:strand:+ start:278 stop:520 length:243 start_codon:yes stop_codon:yes gene_type:complete
MYELTNGELGTADQKIRELTIKIIKLNVDSMQYAENKCSFYLKESITAEENDNPSLASYNKGYAMAYSDMKHYLKDSLNN